MNKMDLDYNYLEIIGKILNKGVRKPNRTGIDTLSIFNQMIETPEIGFDGFPISKVREIYYKGAIIEALWILGIHQNDEKYCNLPFTNTKYLEDNGVKYWRPWQDKDGNLGPVYGAQLSRWKKYKQPELVMDDGDNAPQITYINQVQQVIDTLLKDKYSRHLVCSMWNPAELEDMALPPCHYAFEFYVRPAKQTDDSKWNPDRLDLRFIQRSCDMLIGIPYDILIYSIILKVVALCTGFLPGKIYGSLGDCHVYVNQIEQAKPLFNLYRSKAYSEASEVFRDGLTQMKINDYLMNKWQSRALGYPKLSDFNPDGSDFEVINYKSLPKIQIPVAI